MSSFAQSRQHRDGTLDKIFVVAHTVDANTMSLQYLETLRSLGASAAAKFIFPMEFTRLLEPMFNHKAAA